MSRHGLHGGSASTAKFASVSICSGPPAQITARNIARAESNDAEPSSGTASNDGAVDDGRPALGLAGLPGEHGDPAGEDGERRVGHDAGVAERREPALHRRHLADAVDREHQLRQELRRSGRVPRCSSGARAPFPVTRWPRTSRRLGRCSLGTISGSTRRSSPSRNSRNKAWNRYHSRCRSSGMRNRLVASRRRSCACASESPSERIGERRRQLVEHRGSSQELLRALGQLYQRLAVEVVGHVAVVARDREIVTAAVARDHRREVEPDRPAFRAFGDGGGDLRADVEVGRAKICAAPVASRARSLGPNSRASPDARNRARCGCSDATRCHQLGAARDSRDEHAQRIVAVLRLQLVEVVDHEHERIWACARGCRQARRGASQQRHAEAAHDGPQFGAARGPSVGRRHQGQECCGIIVETGERHPRDLAVLPRRPLGHERRLAVPRGRGDSDHAATAGAGGRDEMRARLTEPGGGGGTASLASSSSSSSSSAADGTAPPAPSVTAGNLTARGEDAQPGGSEPRFRKDPLPALAHA